MNQLRAHVGEGPEPAPTSEPKLPATAGSKPKAKTDPAALAELTARIEAVELRSPLDEARERQNGLDRRLDRLEMQEAARLEASRALEEVIGAVAAQICESEGRAELNALQTREGIRALRRRLDRMEGQPTRHAAPAGSELAHLMARMDEIEAAGRPAADTSIDVALSSLVRRVEEGEQHTSNALRTLGDAVAGLEALVRGIATPSPASVATDEFSTYHLVEQDEVTHADLAIRPADTAMDRGAESLDELGEQLRRVIDAFENTDAPATDDAVESAKEEEGWSVESFSPTHAPETAARRSAVEARLPTPVKSITTQPTATAPLRETAMMDQLCEALPSVPASTHEDYDRIDVLNAVQAQRAELQGVQRPSVPPELPIPLTEPMDAAGDLSAIDSLRRRRPESPLSAASDPGSDAGANLERPAEPPPPVEDRLHEVDVFLAPQLTPLTAPRVFAPEMVEGPASRPGAHRDLIESARTAARESADSKRRFPLDALTAKSGDTPGSDAGEVLDLRNGFGLLRRRNQRAG